jgi:hypothetical protein
MGYNKNVFSDIANLPQFLKWQKALLSVLLNMVNN